MGKQPDEIDDISGREAGHHSDIPLDDVESRPMDQKQADGVYVEVVSLSPAGDAVSTDTPDRGDLGEASDIEEQVAAIEETRAEMSETIDAIEQRLNPDRVKERAAEAVRNATLGQAERIVGNAGEQAGQARSGVMAIIKQHPAEVATAATTIMVAAVTAGIRARLAQVEEPEAPTRSRTEMVTNQVRSLAVRAGQQAGTPVGSRAQLDLLAEVAGRVRHMIDENRTALAAALTGVGLTAAGRVIDAHREPSVSPTMKASEMMKSPWSLLLVLAPVAAGAWLARRLVGQDSATGQDLLLAWLNDAYGMENTLIQTLQNHARDAKNYPQMQVKLDQHLAQTRRHAEMVKSCIERLGGRTNPLKTSLGVAMGKVQGLSTGAAADEVVKDGLADFAAENFEIASYTALIAAAEQLGDRETVATCNQILREEQEMARWLEQNLPATTRETVNRL